MNVNKGYIGWSESRRSAEAKENGELPKTLFKKKYKLSEKKFQSMLKDGFIIKTSWHHTSIFFNKTDFYSFTNDGLFFIGLIDFEEYFNLEFSLPVKKVIFPFEYKFDNKKRHDSFLYEGHVYEIHKVIKGCDLWVGKSFDSKRIRVQIDTFTTKTGKIGQIVLESYIHSDNEIISG